MAITGNQFICPGDTTTLFAPKGGAAYAWTPGGETTDSIRVSPTVQTPYTCTITSVAGPLCTTTLNYLVNVYPQPLVWSNNDTICIGEQSTLTATPSTPGGTYLWTPGGQTTQSITVSPAVTTAYTCSFTDTNGCTHDSIGTVVVNPLPTAIDQNPAALCEDLPGGGTVANIDLTSYNALIDGGTNTTISWFSNATLTTPVPTPTNVTVSNLLVFYALVDDGNCQDTAMITFLVVPLPTANAGVDDTTCTLTYNLNAIPSLGIGTWTGPPGVNFGTVNSPNSTVTAPLAGTYQLIWTEDNGGLCVSSDTVNITFVILSIPNTPTNPTCNGGNTGQIVLAPQGGIPTYTYLWGPNANNQTTNPGINLPAGTFTVRVTDSFGCFLDSTFTLTEPPPFTFTTDSGTANCGLPDGWAAVIGFAGGTPGYTYDWGNGPTTNDTLLNLVPGVYTVIVKDALGCDTTITINVNNTVGFTASITAFTDALCFGSADGTATADGSNPLVNYTFIWNTVPAQVTQTAIGLAAGTYMCTVTDPNTSCSDTVSVTINEPTKVDISAVDDTICEGQNVNISALATNGNGGPYTYTWENGLFVGNPYNVSPTVTTVYTVYALSQPNNCPSDTINVTVFVYPPLAVVASADDSICPGDNANIFANAMVGSGNGGPYTYTWSNAFVGQNQNVSPAITTTYVVTLTDGCSTPVMDTVIIYVKPLPVVEFEPDTFSLCERPLQAFTFYNTSPGSVTNTFWTFGDGMIGTGDTVSHTYSSPGTYDISLTVTSTITGCSNSLTKLSYVQVFANPIADFSMSPNPTTMLDPTINFLDNSYTNITNWDWDFGGLGVSILQNPTFIFPEDTGQYMVMLAVIDANGCKDTIFQLAIVIGEYGIYVPNAFTPDFDGVNDGFYPKGFGISDDDYSMFIFDRWGELIFETHKKFAPWFGVYKNKLVQNGVYVWKLEFKDINGDSHSRIGHVTIVK